jgi:hypothetical protein
MIKRSAGIAAMLAVSAFSISGCAVVAVTDAAVTVASTAVKVGANVVGTASDIVRGGVRAVTGNNDQKK